MSDDVIVIAQELRNLTNQMGELQATLMLWINTNNAIQADQQKKTFSSPTNSDNLRYGSPTWSSSLSPPPTNSPLSPNPSNATVYENRKRPS